MFIPVRLCDGAGLSNGILSRKRKSYTKHTEAKTWQTNITETKTRRNTLSVTVIDGLARNFMQDGTPQLIRMQS